MKKLYRNICFLGLFAALPAFAADSTLSLDQAIKSSLKNNKQFKIAIEKQHESKIKLKETWGMLWPTLSTSAVFAKSNQYETLNGTLSISVIDEKLTVNPGVLYNSLKAAQASYSIAENEVRNIRNSTTVNTINSYYQTILARENLALRQSSIKALQENFNIVNIGYKKGLFSQLDFLKAEVALSNEKVALVTAKNNLDKALTSLNIQLGNEINNHLVLPQNGFEYDPKEIRQFVKAEGQMEAKLKELTKIALENRPELIQLQDGVKATKYGRKAAAAVLYSPTFFVNTSWGYNKNFVESTDSSSFLSDAQLDAMYAANQNTAATKALLGQTMASANAPTDEWKQSWQIQVGASMVWGDWCPASKTFSQAQQSKSKIKQQELQISEFIQMIELEIKNNYYQLRSAADSLLIQEGNIKSAETALRVAKKQFLNGVIDNSEYLKSVVDLNTAKTYYIQALFNFQLAKANVNKAIGQNYYSIK